MPLHKLKDSEWLFYLKEEYGLNSSAEDLNSVLGNNKPRGDFIKKAPISKRNIMCGLISRLLGAIEGS